MEILYTLSICQQNANWWQMLRTITAPATFYGFLESTTSIHAKRLAPGHFEVAKVRNSAIIELRSFCKYVMISSAHCKSILTCFSRAITSLSRLFLSCWSKNRAFTAERPWRGLPWCVDSNSLLNLFKSWSRPICVNSDVSTCKTLAGKAGFDRSMLANAMLCSWTIGCVLSNAIEALRQRRAKVNFSSSISKSLFAKWNIEQLTSCHVNIETRNLCLNALRAGL